MKHSPKQSDIDRVLAALRHGRWVKGRALAAQAGVPFRAIRAIAQQTGEIISSQQGYKLTSRASAEEIERAQADLNSRARHMQERAAKLERYMPQRQGVLL